jgi:hypothetical protein
MASKIDVFTGALVLGFSAAIIIVALPEGGKVLVSIISLFSKKTGDFFGFKTAMPEFFCWLNGLFFDS